MTDPKLQVLLRNWAIALLLIFCLTPIVWQLLTSFKPNADIAATPNIYWPEHWTRSHYIELFTRRPFQRYLLNSTIVAVSSTILALGLGAPAAYALARMKLPGAQAMLAGVLIVTLFPYILLFLGLLEILQRLGWGNTYLALIVPYTAINLPLTILVLRSGLLQLPIELEDAAKVDGYGLWPMLWQIILPMTAPALVTTGILTFIFAWNEFIFALTFITKESMKTIPVAVSQLGNASVFEIPYGPIAAATVIGTLPLVILVMAFQRRIVSGLTTGAVKG
jgi:multiple sugar transport system permease protein